MYVFAHRGLPFEYPENSLLSFEKALEAGFGLEIDIHLSRDGHIVVMHDLNTKRLTGHDANLTEMNVEAIKTLKILDKEPIPTVKEVVQLFRKKAAKGAAVAVHVKDEKERDILERMIAVIAENDLLDAWFLFDLTKEGAKKAKGMNKNVKIALSVGEKKYAPTIYLLDEVLDDSHVDAIWADEWVSGLYSKEFFDRIRSSGKESWVISPELHRGHGHPLAEKVLETCWESLLSWKVDGICTDYPKEFQALRERKPF